jgi:pimeloyl-ACP methyl ester carboxylesterase
MGIIRYMLLKTVSLFSFFCLFSSPAWANHNASAIKQTLAQEQQLSLQSHSKSQFFEVANPKGVVVLLHGFTAGTWQYETLKDRFLSKNYCVYIPRLLGHGFQLAPGVEDFLQLPQSGDLQSYLNYTTHLISEVKALDLPIHLVGLSGGATVALDWLTRGEKLQTVTLMAPFVLPKNGVARVLFGLTHGLDTLNVKGLSQFYNTYPFNWGEAYRPQARAEMRAGHWDMVLGNIYGLSEYGRYISEKVKPTTTPVQMINTYHDDATDPDTLQDIYSRLGGSKNKHGWYFFKEADKVPHPMIHYRENAATSKLLALEGIIEKVILTSQTSNL